MLEGIEQTFDSGAIETLRMILEEEQSRSIPYDEALEAAQSLLGFFELLTDSNRADSNELPQLGGLSNG